MITDKKMVAGNSGRSIVAIRMESLYRRVFMSKIADKKSSFVVVEFPKSGGSWITGMLSNALDVDFPRNRFPTHQISAFQGHYLKVSLPNKVVIWRDPRDIMVSWYFHSVVGNDHVHSSYVKKVRANLEIVEPENIDENLERFIHYCFQRKNTPGFNWNDFFDSWFDNSDAVHLKYERMLSDPVDELAKAITYLNREIDPQRLKDIVDSHSFKATTGREPGVENNTSFQRKGVAGAWTESFNPGALSAFNSYVGDRLHRLEYER